MLRCRAMRSWFCLRAPAAAGVVAAVLAGLWARHALSGWLAKYLGVALWSTCVYCCVLVVWPRAGILRAGLLTLALSWAVEFAQLTPGPAALSSKHILLRLVFGTTFSAADLPAYAAGTLLGCALHKGVAAGRASGTKGHGTS